MIRKMKLRVLLLGVCITLVFFVLIGRVFWIQAIEGDFWTTYTEDLIERNKKIPANRGTIKDRNGVVLATDAPAYTVAVNPRRIYELGIQEEVVKRLSNVLSKDEQQLRDIVTAKNEKGQFYIHREVRKEGHKIIDLDMVKKIDEFRDELAHTYRAKDIITMAGDTRRYYPKHTFASHMLGYINYDGKAIGGLEQFYNDELQGISGYWHYQSDSKGIKLVKSQEDYKAVVHGKNLKLTIDEMIQYYIEEAAREAYYEYNPLTITIIAADPKTMSILGMANMPNFNPNTYWETKEQKCFFNHAIQAKYEPGSTFKIVTLAGAVQEKKFNPNETFLSKARRIDKYTIRDDGKEYGRISYLEGIKRSSNIAFVNLGLDKLGPKKLRYYIDQFGFGKATNLDLPNEIPAVIPELKAKSDIAAACYGHGLVTVTPIQQLTAICSLANGGKLMKPYLVKEIIDPNTNEVKVNCPQVIRQVVSETTAKQVGQYLEQVVVDQALGTGRRAYIEGYRVAGKTGTAKKIIKGKYDITGASAIGSFIGYAPVHDPKIALIVVMDQPNSQAHGSTASATVFKKIVSQTLHYLKVPKEEIAFKKQTKKTWNINASVPYLKDKTVKQVKTQLLRSGISYVILGNGERVIRQYPEGGVLMKPGQKIHLLTEESSHIKIPDFTGKSLRDVLEMSTFMKIGVEVKGEGYVCRQEERNSGEERTLFVELESPKKPNL